MWAFGITVLELFSYGMEPWPGLNGAEVRKHTCTDEFKKQLLIKNEFLKLQFEQVRTTLLASPNGSLSFAFSASLKVQHVHVQLSCYIVHVLACQPVLGKPCMDAPKLQLCGPTVMCAFFLSIFSCLKLCTVHMGGMLAALWLVCCSPD